MKEERDNKEPAPAATDAIDPRELRFMNSRARELLLRYWDFPLFDSLLRKHGVTLENGAVLDAGCGSGYTTLLIREKFNPRQLDAFDIVEGQVALARSRGLDANSDLTGCLP